MGQWEYVCFWIVNTETMTIISKLRTYICKRSVLMFLTNNERSNRNWSDNCLTLLIVDPYPGLRLFWIPDKMSISEVALTLNNWSYLFYIPCCLFILLFPLIVWRESYSQGRLAMSKFNMLWRHLCTIMWQDSERNVDLYLGFVKNWNFRVTISGERQTDNTLRSISCLLTCSLNL